MLLCHADTEPLRAHRLFVSRHLDETRDIVAKAFCGHRLAIANGACAGLETVHNHARGVATSLNFLRYGADVEIEPGELTRFYLLQVPLSGSALIAHGRVQVEAAAQTRSGTILNPTRYTRMRWSGGCAKLLLQIDRAYLNALAERLVGHALVRDVVFDVGVALDAPAAQEWVRRLATIVARSSETPDLYAPHNRHQALREEALVAAFIEAQPSNMQHLLQRPLVGPSGRQVRRALDYIHAHVAQPMTMSDVADAAGCSLRCLQMGFRQSVGMSPLTYLRRRRLMLAHHVLKTGDGCASVASAASDVGYEHMGRFAQEYRALFGCPPSATLAQALR